MNQGAIRVICAFLMAGLICCAGCMSPQVPGTVPETPSQVPSATVSAVPSTVSPAATVPPVVSPASPVPPGITTAPAGTVPVKVNVTVQPTWIPETYGKDALVNPKVLFLSFNKSSMDFTMPDCAMRIAFPQAAADPQYGIRKAPPKLVMLTEADITAFRDTYSTTLGRHDNERYIDPLTIGGARCVGIPANPVWNFLLINTTFVPRNTRPGEYDIGINLRSHGNVIGQLRMNASFTLDKPVNIVRSGPLKDEEKEAFDSIDLVFAKTP
jgi:hypothetical protein